MAIYDCFMFNNEIELLEMRLQYLYDAVDFFVICEAKCSHSMKCTKDEYVYNRYKHTTLKPYVDKIIFLPIERFPQNSGDATIVHDTKTTVMWPNENFQRMHLFEGLAKASDNDIIIISDVDEIPFIKSIEQAKHAIMRGVANIIGIRHTLFYYCFNLQKSQLWEGSIIFKKQELRKLTLNTLLNTRENAAIDFNNAHHVLINDSVNINVINPTPQDGWFELSVNTPSVCFSRIEENIIVILVNNLKATNPQLYDALNDKRTIFKLITPHKNVFFKNDAQFSSKHIIQQLRNYRTKLGAFCDTVLYINGGVHYSWFGSPSQIKHKFECVAEHDIINNFNTLSNITACVKNGTDLFHRTDKYGCISEVQLTSENSLPNVQGFIKRYPHFIYRKPVILVNDYCRGLIGERVLWNFMLEGIPNLYAVDTETLDNDHTICCTDAPFEDKIAMYIEKYYPTYSAIVQNGTFFPIIPLPNKPRICIIQDNLRKMQLPNLIQEQNLKIADYIVTNSKEVHEYYPHKHSIQIPLGVDDQLFTPLNKSHVRNKHVYSLPNYCIRTHAYIGIFVGAFDEVKGWPRIKHIIERDASIFWILITKQASHEIKLCNASIYTQINQSLLVELLNCADFFIIGSPVETQCLAAIEAGLCNIPIIMRPTGFTSNFSKNDNNLIGIIHDDLEMSITRFKTEHFAFNPREILTKHFSIKNMNDKWIDFLDTVTSKTN
jgi:glycosyltransferase involved in cell wall biosynthesis